MLSVIAWIESVTLWTGKTLRWLALLMVLLVCAVVVRRYFLSSPSLWLQETSLYLHAALFMAGIAYTWQQGGHVRVDVFSKSWSKARNRRLEQLGILFLLMPFCVFLFWGSWHYVEQSWAIGERSEETGGLPFVYLLKTLLLVLPTLMLLQAVAELGKTFYPEHFDKESRHG
ncbi:MAG: dicarboxylate transporter, inner rane small subunit [Pseudomonadota bacterium]|jgi:TRAP-type mannitol/chloroaromatic compound transport system permease small subunit